MTQRTLLNVLAVANGTRLPLSECGSDLWQSGLMGCGAFIHVSGSQLVAPVDGIVVSRPDCGYELTIKTRGGFSVWLKLGEGTEHLKGEKHRYHVQHGQAVNCGDPVMTINPQWLKSRGIVPQCAVLVPQLMNADRIADGFARQCRAGEDILFSVTATD